MSAFVMAVCFLGFYFCGFYQGRLRRSKAPAVKDPTVCSCEHVYSVHDGTGKCLDSLEMDKYNRMGDFVGVEWHLCPCVRYDGVPPAHVYLRREDV
jgi:hypothetical protein